MSGTHWNDGCCFDYGNSETDDKNDGCATMEAIYFGNASWHGNRGAGTGPWLGGDFEQGMYNLSQQLECLSQLPFAIR